MRALSFKTLVDVPAPPKGKGHGDGERMFPASDVRQPQRGLTKVALFTGGAPHYEQGLVSGLIEQRVHIDVIGDCELARAPVMRHPGVSFLGLHVAAGAAVPKVMKLARVVATYLRMVAYALKSDAPIFHIQWPYKIPALDRTILLLLYKLLRKKIVFTAHNVDQAARDGRSTWIERVTLRWFYRRVDHIIAHTTKCKAELVSRFGVRASNVSVIPHGVMSSVPRVGVTRKEARRRLGIQPDRRVVLFFGLISPYKGIELLVDAFSKLAVSDPKAVLLIAGRVKECVDYWSRIEQSIDRLGLRERVVTHLRHIPDEDIEKYFAAADVLVMPYRSIFQSGVLFLAYRFGLPVVATDVGSLRDDIVEGRTGFVCKPNDSVDLARALSAYFSSGLFRDLETQREDIIDYASHRYSWSTIGAATADVYQRVLR